MEKPICDECDQPFDDGATVAVVERNPTRRMEHSACAACWPHAERERWVRDAEASGRKVSVSVISPLPDTARAATRAT